MISTVIAVPYELARLPLVVLDTGLSGLPETSVPRVTLDRAIGTSDRLAGAVLRNDRIAQRGADRIERSHRLQLATRLEQEAATRRVQARETAEAGSRRAARQRQAAEKRVVSGLKEADAAEARGKAQAKASATRTASARKAAADKRAAGRTAKVAQAKARVDSAAQAKKRTAQRVAGSELDDARSIKRAAARTRADANRLSDLTVAKKRARKQG